MAEFKVDIPLDEVAEFCRLHQIQRLAIFGSVLEKDFGPNSDVDVLVDFEPEAHVGFVALSQMQRELSGMLDRPVDLVPRAGLKPAIREAVLASAETLYAT